MTHLLGREIQEGVIALIPDRVLGRLYKKLLIKPTL